MNASSPKKVVLIVEDDHFQAEGITKAIEDAANKGGGQAIEIVVRRTEHEAYNELANVKQGTVHYDCYVIDLMLPWARGNEIPNPADFDSRIASDGGLKAGFRIIEKIRRDERERSGPTRPTILYTVATILLGTDSAVIARVDANGHRDEYSYERLQKEDGGDETLAEAVVRKLKAD